MEKLPTSAAFARPMIATRPPGLTPMMAASTVTPLPRASKATSTPPPLLAAISSATRLGSLSLALTASVAPSRTASSSFASSTSTATILAAPAALRICTTDPPMPPQPTTAAVSPRTSWAVLCTAPYAVNTEHPTMLILLMYASSRV
ncbi:MAG: hypothetical protein VXZ39_13135, partial [Planctomycetota bacterium]|nr:hypothetical protein [Planctomycetota bacterium]